MRTMHTRGKAWCSTVGALVLALVVIVGIGGIALGPAFGQEPERRHADERRRWQAERGHAWRERQVERRWRTYPPYGYYAPPPVVYPPVPSPGINLFFHFP
jgi:hypothetical protein